MLAEHYADRVTTPPQITRAATVRAMLLVLTGSLGMQVGAAISLTLFVAFGPAGTSALRMLIAALVMLVVFRPKLRGRTPREWAGISLYGIAMAAMNLLIYQAIDRLPLGVATTLDFLGPCVVALLASRRLREVVFATVAFGGVVLMAGFGGPFDPIGLMWGVLAGASFAGYTLLAPRIGQLGGGTQAVALAVTVAAVITLPFSVPHLAHATVPQWGLLAISALVGTALPFIVDTIAGRITSARVLGVFFAFDPLLGTIVGALVLSQVLTPAALAGVVLVVAAGAGIVWSAGTRATVSTVNTTQEVDPVNDFSPIAGTESVEIERKYEVPSGAELPSVEEFAGRGLRVGATATHELHARYFDTADGALAAARLAMRVRVGGTDEGWHVKEKIDGGTRELHWPLSDEMPPGLVAELRGRIGDAVETVRTIAELRTERRTLRLENADGIEVVEIADDRVRAAELRGADVNGDESRVDRAWREWEAELMPGADVAWLDATGELLESVGAVPSLSIAKVARASGALVRIAEARGAAPEVIAALQQMDSLDREAARRLDS